MLRIIICFIIFIYYFFKVEFVSLLDKCRSDPELKKYIENVLIYFICWAAVIVILSYLRRPPY